MVAAKKRATGEQREITQTINNLLDNITAANRDMVDLRLDELKGRLREIEGRLSEFDQLIFSQIQIRELVSEAGDFLRRLDVTFSEGEPHERLLALRQCLTQIQVNKPSNTMSIQILIVPAGGLVSVDTLSIGKPA